MFYLTVNNCTNKDSLVVIENVNFPSSEAGDALSNRNDEPIISLPGTIENANFSIQWTAIEGQILDEITSLNTTVLSKGWCYLEVFN